MSSDTRDIARKLSKVQSQLRRELLEELQTHEDDIESVFDPYSYSPVVQEIREKYLTRLQIVQAIIQELAHYNQGRRQPPVKVLSLRGKNSEELVENVNEKLATLNGAKVMDVEFLHNEQQDHWVAIITYVANPFTETQDETAAFM